jgi:hypothetical protein
VTHKLVAGRRWRPSPHSFGTTSLLGASCSNSRSWLRSCILGPCCTALWPPMSPVWVRSGESQRINRCFGTARGFLGCLGRGWLAVGGWWLVVGCGWWVMGGGWWLLSRRVDSVDSVGQFVPAMGYDSRCGKQAKLGPRAQEPEEPQAGPATGPVLSHQVVARPSGCSSRPPSMSGEGRAMTRCWSAQPTVRPFRPLRGGRWADGRMGDDAWGPDRSTAFPGAAGQHVASQHVMSCRDMSCHIMSAQVLGSLSL